MSNGRILYLDNLRSFAMLFGLLVHGSALATQNFMFVFETASYFFRMGSFFAISGFFAALLIDRRGVRKFLTSRMIALGLPFLTVTILLNYITIVLVLKVRMPEMSDSFGTAWEVMAGQVPEGFQFLSWHLHLWFLVSLIVYTACAPLALSVIDRLRSHAFIRRLAAQVPVWLTPLVVALIIGFSIAGLRVVSYLISSQIESPWLLWATMTYAPYYLLGLLLFRERGLWERLHRIDLPLIVVALALIALRETGLFTGQMGTLLHEICRGVVVIAVFCALLSLFRRYFNNAGPVQAKLSGSIYTIYLLHYILIFVYGLILMNWFPMTGFIGPTLAVLLAGGTSFVIHQRLVMRVPLLLLLLNGKRSAQGK